MLAYFILLLIVVSMGSMMSYAKVDVRNSQSFVDISEKSGITYENYVVNPPNPITGNDHSRLGFADINGDGWDDVVMHNAYPTVLTANIPFEHLVFVNNKDGTFMPFSDQSRLRNVQSAFFVFADIDNDGDQDLFSGVDYPFQGICVILCRFT
jgi:hypothetical protein